MEQNKAGVLALSCIIRDDNCFDDSKVYVETLVYPLQKFSFIFQKARTLWLRKTTSFLRACRILSCSTPTSTLRKKVSEDDHHQRILAFLRQCLLGQLRMLHHMSHKEQAGEYTFYTVKLGKRETIISEEFINPFCLIFRSLQEDRKDGN